MRYCTDQDVKDVLEPASDAPNNASTAASLPTSQINDAIDEASGIVYTYVQARYEVELAVPVDGPATNLQIRHWTRNIAAYLATLVYKRNKDVSENDPIRLRYIMTMGMLADVKAGRIDLDVVAHPTEYDDDITVVNQYEGTLFGPVDFGLATGYHRGYHIWPGE